MKIYVVEVHGDDYYDQWVFSKVFKSIVDARAYCNSELLKELEEKGEWAKGAIIKTKADGDVVYEVEAVQYSQELKLTSKGDFYRSERRGVGSSYRVTAVKVE